MSVKRHWDRIRQVNCILCRYIGLGSMTPAQIHHIGDSAERDDYLVIPLCEPHHKGANGFHGLGEREFNRRYRTSEMHLLGLTLRHI